MKARAVASRVLALLALCALSTSVGGCGLRMIHRDPGMRVRGSNAARSSATPRAAALDPVARAREQARLQPQDPYWPYRVAQLCLDGDSLALAEAALRASLDRDSSYAPALSLLSKLCFQSARHAEAIRLLEPVRVHPERFAEDARAVLLLDLALQEEAIGQAGDTRALLPPPSGSVMKLGGSALTYLTLRGEHPDSADALAEAALRAASSSAANLNNFGITRLRAGDPVAARRAFASAIERDPGLPGPYYNLAILEKYYVFDDAAANRWFAAYRHRSAADPDSLFGAFGEGERKALASKGTGR